MSNLEKLGEHIRLVTLAECPRVDRHAARLEELFEVLRDGAFDALSVPDVFTLASKSSLFAMVFEREDYSFLDEAHQERWSPRTCINGFEPINADEEFLPPGNEHPERKATPPHHNGNDPELILSNVEINNNNNWAIDANNNQTATSGSSLDADGFPLASSIITRPTKKAKVLGAVDWVGLYNSGHSESSSSLRGSKGKEKEEDAEATSANFSTPPETGTPTESNSVISSVDSWQDPFGTQGSSTESIDANPRLADEPPRTSSSHVSLSSPSKRSIKNEKAKSPLWGCSSPSKVLAARPSAAPQPPSWYQDYDRILKWRQENTGLSERKNDVKETNQPRDGCIGFVYLIQPGDNQIVTTPGPGESNFGIVLAEKHRGKGYAFEAATFVLTWAFETLGYHRVQAIVLDTPRNVRATTFFTQLRFGHEGTRRLSAYCTRRQQWRDVTYFAILDTDWIMRTLFKPAPRSAWDELFARHQVEREKLLQGDDLRLKRTSSMETVRLGRKSNAVNFEEEELQRAIALSLLDSSSASSSASSAGIATPSSPSMISTGMLGSEWDTWSRASAPLSSEYNHSSDFEQMDVWDDDNSDS